MFPRLTRTALLSTSPWIGHSAWMYTSSARVKAGLCGAVDAGCERAEEGARLVIVASRIAANARIPSRATTAAASAARLMPKDHDARTKALTEGRSPVRASSLAEAAPSICFLAYLATGPEY